jgi:hypothetical protein
MRNDLNDARQAAVTQQHHKLQSNDNRHMTRNPQNHSYSHRNRSPAQAQHLQSSKQQLLLLQQQQQQHERDMWARAGAGTRMSTKETASDRQIKIYGDTHHPKDGMKGDAGHWPLQGTLIKMMKMTRMNDLPKIVPPPCPKSHIATKKSEEPVEC